MPAGGAGSLEGDPNACHLVVAGREPERWGTGGDKCEAVARYCDQDGIVNWLEVYFCDVRRGGAVGIKMVVFWASVSLLLPVLFLALGSTAEDYFAPVLTQMCEGMGLPPRFAGVTFLALANGAPDVSATLAAIREGGDGVYLSLGALTGAGMFVTTVAAALVIIAAGGASMKGALLRDVAAYIGALVLVAFALSSGQLSKNFGFLLIGVYFSFVLVVLAADTWHRRVKVMARAREITQPLVRNVSTRLRRASISFGGSGRAVAAPGEGGGWAEFQGPRHGRGAYLEHVFQNLDKKGSGSGTGGVVGGDRVSWSRSHQRIIAEKNRAPSVSPAHSLRDMQEDCSLEEEERPNVEMGDVPALVGGERAGNGSSADQSGASWGGLSGGSEDLLEGNYGRGEEQGYGVRGGGGVWAAERFLALRTDIVERFSTLPEAFADHAAEQRRQFQEYSLTDKLCYVLELPVSVLRWVTIPTVIEETYNRGLLCLATTGSCLFMLGYFNGWTSANIDIVEWLSVVVGAPLIFVVMVCSTENVRAPRLSFGTPSPVGAWAISLFGFVVAACWIDTLANELVGVLDTIGTLAHFSRSILGLTILAWGNSIGDVKTNLAMARRGLGNMAITACIAGPLFNILMGLGAGVVSYCTREGADFMEVQLHTDILVGIILICTNCAAMVVAGAYGRGRIPRKFGYFSLGLYVLYLVLSALHIFKVL